MSVLYVCGVACSASLPVTKGFCDEDCYRSRRCEATSADASHQGCDIPVFVRKGNCGGDSIDRGCCHQRVRISVRFVRAALSVDGCGQLQSLWADIGPPAAGRSSGVTSSVLFFFSGDCRTSSLKYLLSPICLYLRE